MTTTPKDAPYGFWKAQEATLRSIAPSMTAKQLAAHFNTTKRRVQQQLAALEIDYIGKRTPMTEQQKQMLAAMAPTHTPTQLAAHFGRTVSQIHSHLARHKIKAKHEPIPSIWPARREELQRIAPGMTLKQLQAHYQQQGHEHTTKAIYSALHNFGIAHVHDRAASPLYARQAELQELAKTHTCWQIAKHMGKQSNYMQKMLSNMGITPVSSKAAQAPRPKAAQAPKPKPAPAPKLVAPGPRLTVIPPRTSIASKTPAQIIWPAHVQVQRIALATPPNNAPICASTMRGSYRTGQGLTGYQSY